jgi:nitrite reductase/ring-hydroxylating ferredoxin subunit
MTALVAGISGLNDWHYTVDKPQCVEAGEMPVMLVQLRGHIYAMGEICSVAGVPLSEGQIGDTIVTCPWHGIAFRARGWAYGERPVNRPAAVLPDARTQRGDLGGPALPEPTAGDAAAR